MNDYCPDKWVVVNITGKDMPSIDKIFASWYGSYGGSDSWRLNSGIAKVSLEDAMYAGSYLGSIFCFEGSSGSVYKCHKNVYGTNLYSQGIISRMIENAKKTGISIEILPEETNWLERNYAN